MARREAINTFTDGLNTDLNPINTPNTVLTDCLNGTLITYDGNELTLQNDKGNYPLKNCKLKENFIPVGVKEYGDIIYIVSYNPITEQTQIGSYPAPERITDPDDFKGNADYEVGTNNNPMEKTLQSMWSYVTTERNYSELVPLVEILQPYYDGDNKDLTLNPGDEYKIELKYNNLDTFEYAQYLILDEDKKTFDITDNINADNQWHYVNWKVPGYLCVKTKMADIDEFKCGAKIVSPNYIATNNSAISGMYVYLQIYSSDRSIIHRLDLNSKIGFEITAIDVPIKVTNLSNNEITWETKNLDPVKVYCSKILQQNNDSILCSTIYNGRPGILDYTETKNGKKYEIYFKPDSIFTIKVVPFFSTTENNTSKYIYLDKYEKTLSFNLSNKVDVENLKIGDSVWKYTTSDDKLTLKFNTKGVLEQSVFSEDIKLKYNIRRYVTYDSTEVTDENYQNKTVMGKNGAYLYNVNVPEWDPMTETTLSIPFVPFPSRNYNSNHNSFYKEDCYVMEIKFVNESDAQIGSTIKRVILASELLNDFYDSRSNFDDIYFDEWVGKYKDHVKNLEFINDVSFMTNTNNWYTVENATFSDNYKAWSNSSSESNSFSHFVDMFSDKYDLINKEFNIQVTAKLLSSIACSSNVTVPVGPLWFNMDTRLEYDTIVLGDEANEFDAHTGKFNIPSTPISKELKYTRIKEGVFESDGVTKTLFDYDLSNLRNKTVSIDVKALDGNGNYDNPKKEKTPKLQFIIHVTSLVNNEYVSDTQYNMDYTFQSRDSSFVISDSNEITSFLLNILEKENLDYLIVRLCLYKSSNILCFTTRGTNNHTDEVTNSIFGLVSNDTTLSITNWFYVFKNKYKYTTRREGSRLVFIPFDPNNNSTSETILGNIKRLEKSDEMYTGNFYKVDLNSITEKKGSKLDTDLVCKLTTNGWFFDTYDLTSGSDRGSLQNNKPISNLFKSDTFSKISDIILNTVAEDLIIPDLIKNTMDSKFENAETTIGTDNDVIQLEIDKYMEDINIIMGYTNTESSISYVCATTSPYLQTLNNNIDYDTYKDVSVKGLRCYFDPYVSDPSNYIWYGCSVCLGKYYNPNSSTTTTNSQSS